ncbi:MAG: serine/threonine-protein kinase HAL4/sat4 [Alyxoria varia]|nr:MAG: serine/threonine-protein kinase HAL4/sat4 [Alyxoria varia]
MASSKPSSVGSHPDTSPALSSSSHASQDASVTLPPPARNGSEPSTSRPHSRLNGDSEVATQPKKPGFGQKLTRMFSYKGSEAPNMSQESVKEKKALPGNVANGPSDSEHLKRPSAIQTRGRSSSATLKTLPNGTTDKPQSIAESRLENDSPPNQLKRFNMHPDGTHSHHLKSEKRQEKLSDMFRNILIGRKRDGEHQEHQLSLMSSWVEQVKSEKAIDERGGPNCADTLVEKYGKCQEVVGRGAFGIVRISHKADSKDPRREQLYAVKEFRRRPSESPKKYSKRLTSEFCISSALRHPNVIHTLDLMKDAKGDFCEVMEFCAGGDLYSLVLAAGKLEVVEADCLFKQLMRGVEYIHEMGVSHRDLKPENLLLTTHGSLKITDFGNGECFRMAWEEEPHMVAGLCGSAPYISPEEYVDTEFDPRAVDVWACGVIYMAMRTGRHLWRVARRDEDEFYEKYLVGRKGNSGYAPIETLHRARCRNVIYSILDPNPSRRITAHQALKSEWGREIRLCKAGEEGF